MLTKKLELLLIVEDNTDDIMLTSRMIGSVGKNIAIVVHQTGERALEYLQATKEPPQIILLDLGLPKMSGIDFIQAIRENRKLQPIPIVILTGGAMDVARAFVEKVAGFVLKPITTDEFKDLIKRLGFEV